MHIGMLAPISWRVPPRHYGPWELVVSLLTEGLVERGIDVTLFATADSLTAARLEAVCPRPYSEDHSLDPKVWECLHIANAFEHAGEFDLIHNHFDFLPLSYSGLVQTPLLTTIHGFSSERILPAFERYNGRGYFVSISDADRNARLDYVATVYHGIRLDDFRYQRQPADYLLVFGRIHPDKGVAEAVQVARAAGRRLVIAGIIQDQAYFDREVAPHVDGEKVKYIGAVGPEARSEVLGNAYALLHLVNFEEPFGLSMVEAMACGTPVIARRRGSVEEVISPGESGFIVDSPQEALAALGAVDQLDRSHVREYVAQRFSQERMVDGYVQVYEEVLQQHGQPRRR